MASNERNQLNKPKNESTFPQMIIYRSLFILKKKFELHKGEIRAIYQKYYGEGMEKERSSLIPVDAFLNVMKEIEEAISMVFFPIARPNELFVSDMMLNGEKRHEIELVHHQLGQYVKSNMEKYNKLYIEKRDKALGKGEENVNSEGQNEENEETKKPITEYDKEGEVAKTNEELIKENENSPLKPETGDKANEEEGKEKEEKDKEEDIKGKEVLDEEVKQKEPQKNIASLHINTLPVIIADFIQINNDIALLDTNEELGQEVTAIFDKEILQKLEEEAKVAKAELSMSTKMNSELYDLITQKNTLTKSITLYEGLLIEKKRKGDNTIFIQDMLEKLLAQKIVFDHKIISLQNKESAEAKKRNEQLLYHNQSSLNIRKGSPNQAKQTELQQISNLYTRKERREMALKDIFLFYSNQHNLIGYAPLFESIEIKKNHLDMAEFSKFCSDFNIALTKEKLVELYKKNTSNTRSMTYEEFIFILEKIAISLNDSRKKYLNKKIEKAKEAIALMEQNELDREKNQNDKSYMDNNKSEPKPKRKEIVDKALFNYNKEHKKHLEELSSLKYELDRHLKKTYEDITNDFYAFLQLDNEAEYRKKLKGYLLLPFHCQDKTYRIPNKILNKKGITEATHALIALTQKKSEIEKISKAQELLKKDQQFKMKKEQMMIKNKILERNIEMKMKENYLDHMMVKGKKEDIEEIIISKKKREIEKKNNVSWNKLGEMDSEYFELAEIEKNKEIFLETDNSDEMDLLNNLNIEHTVEDKQMVLAEKKKKLMQEKEKEKERKKREEMMIKEEEERKKNEEANGSSNVLDQGFFKDESKSLTKKINRTGMPSEKDSPRNPTSRRKNEEKDKEVLKKGKSSASAVAMPTLPQTNPLIKSVNSTKAMLSDNEASKSKSKANQPIRTNSLKKNNDKKVELILPLLNTKKLNKSNSDHIINAKSENLKPSNPPANAKANIKNKQKKDNPQITTSNGPTEKPAKIGIQKGSEKKLIQH